MNGVREFLQIDILSYLCIFITKVEEYRFGRNSIYHSMSLNTKFYIAYNIIFRILL